MKHSISLAVCASVIGFVAMGAVHQAHASTEKNSVATSTVSVDSVSTTELWKKITDLFASPGLADQLAPGVTQETITRVKHLVDDNVSDTGIEMAMYSVIQQAQNLL